MPFANVLNAQSNEDENSIKNRLNSYLSKGVNNGLLGAVLVVKEGEIILSKGYGLANKEKKIPNTTTTVFDIGSVTKQFTATAILKLVQLNKLNINDPLSKFFHNLPDDKKSITIHQLLTHSAGLIDVIGEGDFDHIPTEPFFRELFATKLIYTPGTKYRYSNSGYSILARIIELVSRKEYEVFLNEYLFEPAGMYETGYLLPKWKNNVFAEGYQYNVLNVGSTANRYQKEGEIPWILKGNGGINSTIEDMFKWYKALKENKVLPKSLTEQLTTPYIAEDEEESSYYAYGWAITNSARNTKIISHNGSNGIFFFDFIWSLDEDLAILFVTNAFSRPIGGVAWILEKMLFDQSYNPKEIKKDLTTSLFKYVEDYQGIVEELASNIKEKFNKDLNHPLYLNRLGGIYLRMQKIDKAIVFFKMNIELFPDDGNTWDNLGEAYLKNNQLELAKNSFKKALELKPENDCYWCQNSSERLKQLKH